MSFTSSSSSSSDCSSSSTSSSSLRIFFNQMLQSLIHPFAPPKQPADTTTDTSTHSSPQDLLSLQHDMNANLSLFEKTYVSFPELTDQDTTIGRHSPPSSIPC